MTIKEFTISPAALSMVSSLKKKDSVVQIVPKADAPIVRMMHIFGKPQILFMRASAAHPTDYHLYRVADDGKTPAEDLTPSDEGVQNIMLGMAYNGRYLYYSSNKRNSAKNDITATIYCRICPS